MTTESPSDTDAARERNRRDFPELARIMDDMRRVFGPGVRLRDGSEGGRSVRKNPAPVFPQRGS